MSRLRTLSLTALLTAVVVLLAGGSGEAIPTFTPGGTLCVENFDANDYNPDVNVRDAGECDGDPSPGAATDVRTKFCAGWSDDTCANQFPDSPVTDSSFGEVINFIPAATVIKASSDYPVGALNGYVNSDAVLGVLGGACNLPINISFSLMNGSVDNSPGNLIVPRGIGERDVMLPLAGDANTNGIPDGADKYPAYLRALFDVDHNYGPDHIPNTSATPSSDDVNGPIPPLQPIARLFATSRIQGSWIAVNFLIFEPGVTLRGPDRTSVQLSPQLGFPTVFVFQDSTVPLAPGPTSDLCAPLRVRSINFGLTRDNPCTGLDTPSTLGNCPSEMDPVGNGPKQNVGFPFLPCENENSIDEDGDGKVNDGCPQVNSQAEAGAACDDAVSSEGNLEDASVNDGCPPVGEGENVYVGSGCFAGGNEGGCEARKNSPQAGTAVVPIYTRSLRDADGDGIENELDSCSLKANPGWNPRALDFANDSDFDGLPNVCDPSPNQAAPNSPGGCEAGILGPDHDQDCYSNRQDNCPLTRQLEDPSQPPSYTVPPEASNNRPHLLDFDGDGIGDACDITACPASDIPGYTRADCLLFGVSANGTSANGASSQDGAFATDCLTFFVTIAPGANPKATGPSHNNDPNCATGPCSDCDGDGFTAIAESGMPLCGDGRNEDNADDAVVDDGCPGGPAQAGSFSEAQFNIGTSDQDSCGNDGWPLDLVSTGLSANRADIQDLSSYIAPVRRYGSKPGDAAFNKRWDVKPGRGASATAWINIEDLTAFFAGVTGYPPMLGSQRAFGRTCPFPP